MKTLFITASIALSIMITTSVSFADTYRNATFTGNISPGSSNVKAPFTSELTQSGLISGSFIMDMNLIPTTGLVNVFFSSFPDITLIPAATAFTINLGAADLTFTLSNAIQNSGAVQFNNGAFNGFFFDTDFLYSDNKPYRLDVQGGTWNIKLLDTIGGSPVPLTSAKVNGHINEMTLGDIYTPAQQNAPIPEPNTMMLLGVGMFGLAVYGKRRMKKEA